jgi:hypothetical protein
MSTRDRCIVDSCFFVHARLSSLEMSLCSRERSESSLNLFVILSHVLCIIVDMLSIRMRYCACACSRFRCMSMKMMSISVFRTAMRMTLNVSKMLRKHLFWMIESLLIIFVFFSLRTCQIVVSLMKIERTTKMYRILILRKMMS